MTTLTIRVLQYMYKNKNKWLRSKEITENSDDVIRPESIPPIITNLYYKGALERKQANGIYEYKITERGIDRVVCSANTKTHELYASLGEIPDVASKILKILEHGYLSAQAVTQKLNLPDHHAGGVGQKLSKMCGEGVVIKKQILYTSCYKTNVKENVIKGSDLERRVHELIDCGITRLEIQKICYDALQIKVDEINENKINDELEYLREHDFTILNMYTDMQKEIEDLKEKLHTHKIKVMVDRQKSDRLSLAGIKV